MPAAESAETLPPVVSVRDLKPDDNNPNKGTKRGSALIEKSLQSYGFGRSIVVDKNNKIIAGIKTQENLVQLGMTEEPIIMNTDGRRPDQGAAELWDLEHYLAQRRKEIDSQLRL